MRPPGAQVRLEMQFIGLVGRVKISEASGPLGAKYSLWKKLQLGGSTCAPITFLLVDQSSSFSRPIGDEMCLMKKLSDF